MAYGDFAIKVGEAVGIVRYNRSYGGISWSAFGTVTKINGHGHIFVQAGDKEYRFTKRGDEYKNEHWGPQLIHVPQLEARLAEQNRAKEINQLFASMNELVKSSAGYSGRYHLTEETVAGMKAVVAKMEAML